MKIGLLVIRLVIGMTIVVVASTKPVEANFSAPLGQGQPTSTAGGGSR